jgi:hypothetical protein
MNYYKKYKEHYLNADGDSLVDVSPDINIDVSIGNSGAAAGGSAIGAGIVSATVPATATGFVATIPVVGQVVAVVSTLVAIGQVFHGIEKQKQLQLAIGNLREREKEIRQEIDIITWEGQQKIDILNNAIAAAQEKERLALVLRYVTLGAVAVTGAILYYSIKKK